MVPYFRPACLALALVAIAGPASAQTWVYESDAYARGYQSRFYAPRYERPYEPVVVGQPLALTPTQRTTVNRIIIPQGRGRGPIVKERIVTETAVPTPVVRQRVVTQPVVEAYGYDSRVLDSYAYAPRPRVVARPTVVDYRVAPRAIDGYAYAPQPVVTTVQPVRSYRYISNRLWLVDPLTGAVVGEVAD